MMVKKAVAAVRINEFFTKPHSTNSFICSQFSLEGVNRPDTIVRFGRNSRMMMITAPTVQAFIFANLCCTFLAPLSNRKKSPAAIVVAARACAFLYFQPTSLKIRMALELLSPRTDNGISCSLKSPHDANNSLGSTFGLTGYS